MRPYPQWLRNVVIRLHIAVILPQQAQYRRKSKVLLYHSKRGAFAYFATARLWKRSGHGLEGTGEARGDARTCDRRDGTSWLPD